jgi:hypothetical protein
VDSTEPLREISRSGNRVRNRRPVAQVTDAILRNGELKATEPITDSAHTPGILYHELEALLW